MTARFRMVGYVTGLALMLAVDAVGAAATGARTGPPPPGRTKVIARTQKKGRLAPAVAVHPARAQGAASVRLSAGARRSQSSQPRRSAGRRALVLRQVRQPAVRVPRSPSAARPIYRPGAVVRRQVRPPAPRVPYTPSVTVAPYRLPGNAAQAPWGKRILVDGSLGEARVNDGGPGGSYNFGQYEVMATLADAGYLVSYSDRRGPRLTRDVVNGYGLVVLNGRMAGFSQTIPPDVVETLVGYVNDGGSLLVVTGGHRLGDGWGAPFYNGLLSMFGLRFREGATLPYHRLAGIPAEPLAGAGLTAFHWEHGVPVEGGEVLGYADSEPVIAAAQYGRGKVVAAGLGSGLMGQCMNTHLDVQPEVASANAALLLALTRYLLEP